MKVNRPDHELPSSFLAPSTIFSARKFAPAWSLVLTLSLSGNRLLQEEAPLLLFKHCCWHDPLAFSSRCKEVNEVPLRQRKRSVQVRGISQDRGSHKHEEAVLDCQELRSRGGCQSLLNGGSGLLTSLGSASGLCGGLWETVAQDGLQLVLLAHSKRCLVESGVFNIHD